MQQTLSLYHIRPGEQLYHYTKCHSVQNIFRTGKIFATKSSFLNDTNEMGYIIHVAQKVIMEIDNREWRQLLLDQIIDTMEDFKRHDIFVLSFSEEKDSIALWAEFGEETGYNLAFDGEEILKRISDLQKIYCHGRVIYEHELQLSQIRELFYSTIPEQTGLSFEAIMDQGTKQPESEVFVDYCRKLQRALNIYAMFFKQEEFQAEREYRIVFKNPDKKKILFRERDGFLVPYIEVDLAENGKVSVQKITVAPMNHIDLARRGMLQYIQSLGYNLPVELSNLKLRY